MQRVTIPDAEIPETDPETLIYCFTPWVQKVANRYRNAIERTRAAVDVDDLLQVGYLGLLRAQKKYDPAGGANFLTFSFYYIRAAMMKEIRQNRPEGPSSAFVSLDEPITEDTMDTLSEIIEDKAVEPAQDRVERQERAAEVHKAVDRLKSEIKREIIRRTYFNGEDLLQVADDLNMKRGAIYAAHNDALTQLRRDHDLVLLCAPSFSAGLGRFRRTWESAVEAEVIWRDEHINGTQHKLEFIPPEPERTWSDKQWLSYYERLNAKRTEKL